MEPILLRTCKCNKYRLQPVSHLAEIQQGRFNSSLMIAKAVIGFRAASSASFHLSPTSTGASTPAHDVKVLGCPQDQHQIYDCTCRVNSLHTGFHVCWHNAHISAQELSFLTQGNESSGHVSFFGRAAGKTA